MSTDLDAHERDVRREAANLLAALPLARRATDVLSTVIEGATIPVAPERTPPSYYVRTATSLLAIIGLRTARACILVVESGYWPEAQALKRRLSEVHARAQAIGTDESGQHARLWLEHKPPKLGKLVAKFANADIWDVYSWSAHADVRSVHQWLSKPIEGRDDAHGILVTPEHDDVLSNALLTEVATDCRDMAMAQAIARATTHAEVDAGRRFARQLDADLDAAIMRWYRTA